MYLNLKKWNDLRLLGCIWLIMYFKKMKCLCFSILIDYLQLNVFPLTRMNVYSKFKLIFFYFVDSFIHCHLFGLFFIMLFCKFFYANLNYYYNSFWLLQLLILFINSNLFFYYLFWLIIIIIKSYWFFHKSTVKTWVVLKMINESKKKYWIECFLFINLNTIVHGLS